MSEASTSQRPLAMLLFQLGERRFAVPAGYAAAVMPVRVPHPVPHRRNPVFLGLIPFAGEIIPCCSLARLLQIDNLPGSVEARTLVLQERPGERWGIPVDAVLGVRRGTLQQDMFVDEEGGSATMLELDSVFARLQRALA